MTRAIRWTATTKPPAATGTTTGSSSNHHSGGSGYTGYGAHTAAASAYRAYTQSAYPGNPYGHGTALIARVPVAGPWTATLRGINASPTRLLSASCHSHHCRPRSAT